MNCELEYCIYNSDMTCILSSTSINSIGMCEECITVRITAEELGAMKERRLREIENRWENTPTST